MESVEKQDKVALSREQEQGIVNVMYDFVVRTMLKSQDARPAEIGVLPEMTRMLISYWPEED